MPPLLRTMRPKQWPKNAFVFIPLLFDGVISGERILRTVIAFFLLCLMSSAVYIMNDLSDIESDRKHPTKRFRPIPAGELSPQTAGLFAVIYALGSLVIGWLLSPPFALVLLIYLIVQIAYTFYLKHVVLLDIAALSSGFVLRIAAGVTVITVERFSPWLYIFGGFLALFMVLGKRRHEIVLLGDDAGKHRKVLKDYNLDLLDRMMNTVTTSAIVSYTLYSFLAEGLPANNSMMLTVPFVIFGIFRYMYLIHVRKEGGAPEEILLKDRPMQIDLVLWFMVVVFVLYLQ